MNPMEDRKSTKWTGKEGLFYALSSAEYHSTEGTYSSSQLKDIEDPEFFCDKYIKKLIEKKEIPAFDTGTYYHTQILEPQNLKDECATFTGIRKGAVWEEFKKKNEGKAIISGAQITEVENLVASTKNSKIAMARIARGTPEVSGFVQILVVGNCIYAPTFGKVLGKWGWEDCNNIPKKGILIWLKVRADLLASDFILDLKSMSGNCRDKRAIKDKVSGLNYDLSAALYLDLFSLLVGTNLNTFIWTFASKNIVNCCKNWKASPNNVLVGRAKWSQAAIDLSEGLETNWKFEESMGVLEPNYWELDILKENEEDQL